MKNSCSRRVTTECAILICVEALIVTVLVLTIINFVAGRYTHSLQGSPMLTFDTSSVKIHLSNQGISDPGNVQDWYEPHYLSVCKGMWQSAATKVKNKTSTVCMEMAAGYTFSLPELLAADANLPANSPLFSSWSFAFLRTEMSNVCLTFALVFLNWTMIDYLIVIVTIPRLTAASSLRSLRVGFVTSILALIPLMLSSAYITAKIHKILEGKAVTGKGVAWSTGVFYALTWLTTGLMCVAVILSVVLAFKLRAPARGPRGEIERKV